MLNTTDTALKEMFDAFYKLKTNKSRIEFIKTHRDSGLYKMYDIKWDNTIKYWESQGNKKRTNTVANSHVAENVTIDN